MIERVQNLFGIKPKRLIGDTAYGTAEMVAWMVEEKAIEPNVPLREKGERDDGTFSRSDFVFDPNSNTMTCPSGKQLVQYRRRNFGRGRAVSPKPMPGYIGPEWPIAGHAPLRRNAVPAKRCAKSSAACTKPRVRLPDASEKRPHTGNRAGIGRRSKCCSLTSSAF